MSRKTNIISNVLSIAITLGSLLAVVMICNQNFYTDNTLKVFAWFALGALLGGLINAFAHELGHVIVGKKNGYVFYSMSVWFFKWTKPKKKIRFSFTLPLDEAGYTEMIPTRTDNVAKRHRSMTLGGTYAGVIVFLLSIPSFFLMNKLGFELFVLWAMLCPMSVYYITGNIFPMSSYGVRNDGAVAYGLKKMDFTSVVTTALLTCQAQMYAGKTPSELDEKLLFDLPQLAEDDPVFVNLLSMRYNYYLDKGDFANAKSITDRLMTIVDDIPKAYAYAVKTDALYNACTFDFNEELADDLTYELEKYLNNVNSVTNVRAKLAYILYVRKENQTLDIFYKKGLKEADRCKIKGQGVFERKLFEKMKEDFPKE